MTRAIIIVVLVVAALGITAGWLVSGRAPPLAALSPTADERADAETPPGRFYRLPIARSRVAALVLAGPAGLDQKALAPPTPPTPAMPAVRITRATVARPIEVDFSDMDLVYPGTADTPEDAEPPPETPTEQRARLSRQLNPNIDEWRPRTDDRALFDQNTGLRGFMTESWLNDSVGIQGGLAIPSERTRDENQSLGDQMAVGMGVLFAF